VERKAGRRKEILHVKHASLVIEGDGHFILTDPWVISPAFSTWTQNPGPAKGMVEKILSIPPGKLSVIISHGHDDHCDDFFIHKHLNKSHFYVPAFKNPGLDSRLKTLGIEQIQRVDENGISLGEFSIYNHQDMTLSEYDSIFTIKDSDHLLVHANDNWHEYKSSFLEFINGKAKKYSSGNAFIAIQFGVADSYPLCYSMIKDEDTEMLLNSRLDRIGVAWNKNIENLSSNFQYFSYANQASFNAVRHLIDGLRPYDLVLNLLTEKFSNGRVTQLCSGKNLLELKKSDLVIDDIVLSSYLLGALSQKITNFLNKNGVTYSVDCHLSEDMPKSISRRENIHLGASGNIWSSIFNGSINLESLTIGCSGLVVCDPAENISSAHHLISKYAYMLQNEIKLKGLGAFL